ncbi:MAG: hypothetical protein M1817_001948 [Caeruleum heppii]|nr:MAG: hypothetical protein M1817_001948 [Caeruleum heppii]
MGLQARQDVGTVVSVVYVTAAPTFDGPIAGYTTIGPNQQQAQQTAESRPSPRPAPVAAQFPSNAGSDDESDQNAQNSNSPADPVVNAPASTQDSQTTQLSETSPNDASLSASVSEDTSASVPTEAVVNSETTPLLSTESTIPTPTSRSSGVVNPASATTSATPEATQATSPSGTSAGAKAGIAFGVLLGLGFIIALVIFFYSRKKKQNKGYKTTDDEKTPSGDGVAFRAGRAPSTRTARTASTAPRLSLRPVTEFLPNISGDRKSTGNQLAMGNQSNMGGAAAGSQGKLGPAMAQRGQTPTQANNPANPFGNQAEPSTSFSSPGQARAAAAMEPPMRDASQSVLRDGASASGGALAAATVNQHRPHEQGTYQTQHVNASATSLERSSTPEATSPNLRGEPSPTGTDFTASSVPAMSMTSQPGGAAGLAGGPGASSVHRVQLDFKPSMEDELELRAGQLVRLLHEYDDGWALCIRLDRSQQGVAPRTCLSTRPVKPRPTNGGQQARPGHPRGAPPPGMRVPPQGGPPAGRPPMMRPMSPAAGGPPRPLSPANGRQSPRPYGQPGRPTSPAGGRQSPRPYPGQQGRPMSPSASGFPLHGQQAPRPMSPSGGRQSPRPGHGVAPPRAMSPANGNRSRSNSAAATNGAQRSPPGPSRMNPNGYPGERVMAMEGPGQTSPTGASPSVGRKPVPGQAI